ncbi:MAG TPA: MaoC family dehydratase N-terminal domain-containing protein [Kiloniellales bacterium]|jgi:3-methylfumaryl-CoA hydratase
MATGRTDEAEWGAWIGRTQVAEDGLDPARARALHATLDLPGPAPGPGDPLPPLWHWLYFWRLSPMAALGPDGHPVRGGFLPPIPLPRRMWAGSRLSFPRPLTIGGLARCRSTIADVRFREGRTGRLAFVTVRHEISAGDEVCVTDEHDIVYRAPPGPDDATRPGEPAPQKAPWQRQWNADPVLLFRYSALTFNGHRIHYDRAYATGVEGYPGLVVHGPLLATLMVELARAQRPKAAVTAFEFRAQRPIFDGSPFQVAGTPSGDGTGAELWVADTDGYFAAKGRVELAGG